ncbi:MAG: amidohydrolase family protein, partial [Acidimicrobiia bacterium]|nr:amidohydrolase family protein [Acidimicrobiia bacterium]
MTDSHEPSAEPIPPLVVYRARRVITLNPARPFATAVAVREGRILGVGSVEELSGWTAGTDRAVIDERFADHLLLPGFVEAHSHVMAGGMWTMPYVGFFDRRSPDGRQWSGCRSIDDVVDRLIEVDAAMAAGGAAPDELLVAWGLDPIYFDGERLVATHLDRVSATRPVFVYHASAHLATVNSALLTRAGITATTPTPGVSRRADGEPDGELQEPPAMLLAGEAFDRIRSAMTAPEALWNYGYEARNAGHTLVTDLGTSQLIEPD